MNRTPHARVINLFEGVRYDVRLHGFRFISLEFALVGSGAVILAIVELLHAGHGGPPLAGGIWFLSVATNCLAVVLLAREARAMGTDTDYSPRLVHLYTLQLVVMLLIPFAVALAALYQWRAGDFRERFMAPASKEIS